MNDLRHISFCGIEPPSVGAAHRAAARGSPSREAAGAATLSEPPLKMEPVMAWMLERAGLENRAYRPAAMQRRLPACLRQLRVPDGASARILLERRPELLPFALSIILIGVSDFFRDPQVFSLLRAEVLPRLLASKRGLRICSVGASGGQELYSVAMLLAELDGLEHSELWGIDCRADAILRAGEGVFRAEDLAGVGARRRERFFHGEGGRWQVVPELRRRIRWQVADLFSFGGQGLWDVVLFRNVAIYFDEAHAAKAWGHLERQLAPGGFLVTGKAERPPAALSLLRVGPCIYQKSHP